MTPHSPAFLGWSTPPRRDFTCLAWRSATTGWTDADNYTGTLEHLASWGIVAAATDTQRGPVPSVLNLSHDLSATLTWDFGSAPRPGPDQRGADKFALAGHLLARRVAAAGCGRIGAAQGGGRGVPAVTGLLQRPRRHG